MMQFIINILRVYMFLIIIRAVVSIFIGGYHNSIVMKIITIITDPLLSIFNRYLPVRIGRFDLAPVFAIISIQIIIYIIVYFS